MKKTLGLWLLVLVLLLSMPGWHAMAESREAHDQAAEQSGAEDAHETWTETDEREDVPPAEPPTFTVRFRANGDSWTLELAEGDALQRPNRDPSKTGFRFLWWYDASGSETVPFHFDTPVMRNLELAALFEEIPAEPQQRANDAEKAEPRPEPTAAAGGDQEEQPEQTEVSNDISISDGSEISGEEAPDGTEIPEEGAPDGTEIPEEGAPDGAEISDGAADTDEGAATEVPDVSEGVPQEEPEDQSDAPDGEQSGDAAAQGDPSDEVTETAVPAHEVPGLAPGQQVSGLPVVEFPVLSEAAPDEQPATERRVSVSDNIGDAVSYGDFVVLTGELTGYESAAYRLQWQVNRGSGWEDLSGEESERYSFILDADNFTYAFRLVVTML